MSQKIDQIIKDAGLPEFKEEWISGETGFTKGTIDCTEKWGLEMQIEGLTNSQIRIFYGELLKLKEKEPFDKKDFLLLRPKVAYAVARSSTKGALLFKALVDKAHQAVLKASEIKSGFNRFFDFFKSTLAYHKVKYWKVKNDLGLPRLNKEWIKNEKGFTNETVLFAEEWGKYLAESKFSNSQIRNVHGEILRMGNLSIDGEQAKIFRQDFLLLRPMIAYASQRSNNYGIFEFKELMDDAHSAVLEASGTAVAFQNFASLYEAILSYHKMYETFR